MSAPGSTRSTAAERREQVLEAALTEFAAHGLDGASTDAIAREAGISQPYLFRLFGTKKQLFIATIERCMSDELARFKAASDGLRGEDALRAIASAYVTMIAEDPRRLRGQMQAYVACDDKEICAVARAGFSRLVKHVEDLGVPESEVAAFFARGMLINVMASMGLPNQEEAWANRLFATCISGDA